MPVDIIITAPNQRSRWNVAQFQTNVLAQLQLSTTNRITNADILVWLNEAQDIIAYETHWYRTSCYIDTEVGVKEYDLPQGLLSVEEVWWDPLLRRLIPMTPEDLEGLAFYSPDWRYAPQGTPIYYYLQVNAALGMHPTPVAATPKGIFLVYSKYPDQMALTTDFALIPPGAERALTEYCCWKASIKDAPGEGQKRAGDFEKLWLSSLQKIKNQVEANFTDDMCVIGEFGTMRTRRWGPRTDWENGSPIVAPM